MESDGKSRHDDIRDISEYVSDSSQKRFVTRRLRNLYQQELFEERKIQKDQYQNYIVKKDIFSKIDNDEYPGIIFLVESFLTKYGLCPHVVSETQQFSRMTCEDAVHMQTELQSKRKLWLHEDPDRLREYMNLKTSLLSKCTGKLAVLEQDVKTFFKDAIGEKDYTDFENIAEYIREYATVTRHTKSKRDVYNKVVARLAALVKKTKIRLDKFISVDTGICDIEAVVPSVLEAYLRESEAVVTANRQNKNILCKAHDNLFKLLMGNTLTSPKQVERVSVFANKKWSTLKPDERDTSIREYIGESELAEIVVASYHKSKRSLTIKWDVAKGLISQIREVDVDQRTFHPRCTTRAKSQLRSHEAEINDMMLEFIMRRIYSNDDAGSDANAYAFVKQMVSKYCAGTNPTADVEYFLDRYRQMFQIIMAN